MVEVVHLLMRMEYSQVVSYMWDSLEQCKDTLAPESVPEFLARLCFTNMLKTIIFFLQGMLLVQWWPSWHC